MSAISIVILLVGVAGVIDAVAHPASEWVHADRKKSFWVLGMIFFNLLFVLPYFFDVRPRFDGANDSPFHKS